MTVIRYPTLFTLGVTHAYVGGRYRDVSYVLGADARRTIGRGRLLAREREGVLHVLYEADADGAPIVAIPGETLRFGIAMTQRAFPNVTALPADVPPLRLLYANGVAADALDAPSRVAFVGEMFTHDVTVAPRPIDVVALDAQGRMLGTTRVVAGQSTATFDLRGIARGPVTVEERACGTPRRTAYWLDADLRTDVLAVVSIRIDASFYDTPPAFEIAFDVRSDRLRFYVVAEEYQAADLATLEIDDAGPVADVTPSTPPAVAFARVAASALAADVVAQSLTATGHVPFVVFESTTPVARRQRAGRRLRLQQNDVDLIANLPQPGADRPDAALIIHVSKPRPSA